MAQKRPKENDRILVLKKEWLALILTKQKTLEIRNRRFKGGIWWLGCKGKIYGYAYLGDAMQIFDEREWQEAREKHHMQIAKPPYPKTYGMPILKVMRTPHIKYAHPQGAIGVVRFKAAAVQKPYEERIKLCKCMFCDEELPQSEFSNTQWFHPVQDVRKCRTCSISSKSPDRRGMWTCKRLRCPFGKKSRPKEMFSLWVKTHSQCNSKRFICNVCFMEDRLNNEDEIKRGACYLDI